MGQIGEILGLGLQARIELGRGARTIVEILRERMDGVDRSVRRPSLKERLGLKGLGCCGPTWGLGLGPTTMSVRGDEEDDEHGHGPPQIDVINAAHNPIQNGPIPPCSPAGMNLAAALAAERQLRAALDFDTGGATLSPSPSPDSHPPRPNRYAANRSPSPSPSPGNATSVAGTRTPLRVSLMRLLEETDVCDGEMKREREGGSDSVCCVCMGGKKGAAFIPCGHTFCRVCSREVWLNRGSCPLCNRSILEILDIY